MKKIVTIASNDWHIKEDNFHEVESCAKEQIDFAVKNEISEIVVLGDIFNSRKSQSIIVLQSFLRILNYALEKGVKVIVIPGNHDKTDYKSEESFLDPFYTHPACFLIRGFHTMTLNGQEILFAPFFKEEIWLEKYDEFLQDRYESGLVLPNVLMSHIAVNGSVNNDGSKVESSISSKTLLGLDVVFLGHYHNTSKPMKNVVHLPSLKQNNFGENDLKGFSVIYEDLTHEIIPTTYKRYIKVKIDLESCSKGEFNSLISNYSNSEDFVRFVLKGSKASISSVDKNSLLLLGIDVKSEELDSNTDIEFDEGDLKTYDRDSILELFGEFCEENGVDEEEGLIYLKEII